MKIAVINDTHFGARNDAEIFSEYFYRFIEEVFIPYLEEHDINTVLHLGDLVDRRKYINFKTLQRLRTRFMKALEKRDIALHLILGNHDVFFKNTSELNSITELFGELNNLTIYAEPETVIFDGLEIGLVPWINRDNYDDSLKFLETTTAEIIMGHFEIQGFEVYKGVRFDSGLSGVPFKRFEAVYSGHFHHKQVKGNTTYLGNPWQITFSDLGVTKGFHVYDTETREMEFVENPHQMFHKFLYDDLKNDYDTTKDRSPYKNRYVKIVVVNKTKPYIFDRFIDSFYDAGVANLSIVEDFSDPDGIEDVNIELDTMTLIDNEIDTMEHLENPEKLKTLVRALYVEALDS